MKTTIIYYLQLILHYLWINRKSIYSLYKDIKSDWKIDFNDFKKVLEYYEKGWVILEENDNVFVWAITDLDKNTSKNLVQYTQSSYSCAIYSTTRAVMYNTNVEYTKDEIESIVQLAKDKWYLIVEWESKGMKVADAQDIIKKWTLANKWVLLKYDKVKFWSEEDIRRKKLWYMHGVGWYISSKYLNDFRYDGVIDEDYTYQEKKLYWHLFTYWPDDIITENYPAQFGQYNRYINKKFKDFINHGYFFSWSYYIFADEQIIDDKVEEMKDKLFTDVNGNTEYYEAIKWAKENGIADWYSDWTLRPEDNLTVWRFLGFLHKYDKQKKS